MFSLVHLFEFVHVGKDHFQHLQRAFSAGDVPKLQKYFAIVQNDPAFADCELVATATQLKALRG